MTFCNLICSDGIKISLSDKQISEMGPCLLTEILESTDGSKDIKVIECSSTWISLLKFSDNAKEIGFDDAPGILSLADKYRFCHVIQMIEGMLVKRQLDLSSHSDAPGYVLKWIDLSQKYHLKALFEACLSFAVPRIPTITGLSEVECICSPFQQCSQCSQTISQSSALLLLREASRQLALSQSALASMHKVMRVEGLAIDLVQGKIEIKDWARWRRLSHAPASEVVHLKAPVARRQTCALGALHELDHEGS